MNDERGAENGRESGTRMARFLRAFAQAVQDVGMYGAAHPVARKAVWAVERGLEDAARALRSREVTLAIVDDRWVLNGKWNVPVDQAPGQLHRAFKDFGVSSLSFLLPVPAPEFNLLCERLAKGARGGDAQALGAALKKAGVRRIRIDVERFVRAAAQTPKAEPHAPAPAPKPAPEPAGRSGFDAWLKDLIAKSVADPSLQKGAYDEAVGLMRDALEHEVDQATRHLRAEKDRLIGVQKRAAQVLWRVAEGRVVVDAEGRVLLMNPAAEDISGKRLADLAGKPILEAVDPESQMAAISKELGNPAKRGASAMRVVGEDEVDSVLRHSIARIENEAGHLVGTLAVLPEATKYKETLRLQEEFLRKVTHELRAPLSSICSALEILRDKAAPRLAAREVEFLDVCRRNAAQLKEMITEILDFSALRAGRLPLHPEPLEPGAALERAVKGLRPWAESAGVSLAALPAPRSMPRLRADKVRLGEILNNLVSNAIKACTRGDSIVLSASEGKGERRGAIVFAVRDNGPGISKEEQGRIFKTFTQGEPGREGFGLGLAIVSDLVGLHGGELWVESEPGRGATFLFTIPYA